MAPPHIIFEVFEVMHRIDCSHHMLTSMQGENITGPMVQDASKLFSDNYGVWQNGTRVRMGPKTIKKMLMPDSNLRDVCLVRASDLDGAPVGHVFACRFTTHEKQICWITQLVVAKSFRRQQIATKLIGKLHENYPDDRYFGILSSHAAAIRATLRAAGRGLIDVDLDTIQKHAAKIMSAAPIEYVRNAVPHGSLFGEFEGDIVSSAGTEFFVDHAEPLDALRQIIREGLKWPLGRLPEGQEFLLIVAAQPNM